jgi:hypothetical protein
MASRLSCWLHGHRWGRWSRTLWSDVFGNDYRVRWCDQCNARDRRIV